MFQDNILLKSKEDPIMFRVELRLWDSVKFRKVLKDKDRFILKEILQFQNQRIEHLNIKINPRIRAIESQVRFLILGNESFSKPNPLKTNIQKGYHLNLNQNNIIRNPHGNQAIIQKRQSQIKQNPHSNYRATSVGLGNKSLMSQQSVPVSIKKKTHENLSLPEDCFFINEKREDLPSDPVELSKLKLIKQKAIQNLTNTIIQIQERSKQVSGEDQIEHYNAQIADLDQKIIETNQRIEEMKNMKNKNPNEGNHLISSQK